MKGAVAMCGCSSESAQLVHARPMVDSYGLATIREVFATGFATDEISGLQSYFNILERLV